MFDVTNPDGLTCPRRKLDSGSGPNVWPTLGASQIPVISQIPTMDVANVAARLPDRRDALCRSSASSCSESLGGSQNECCDELTSEPAHGLGGHTRTALTFSDGLLSAIARWRWDSIVVGLLVGVAACVIVLALLRPQYSVAPPQFVSPTVHYHLESPRTSPEVAAPPVAVNTVEVSAPTPAWPAPPPWPDAELSVRPPSQQPAMTVNSAEYPDTEFPDYPSATTLNLPDHTVTARLTGEIKTLK